MPRKLKRKTAKKKPQTWYGKVWYFLWEDDSVWSWLVDIVLAFILIKFIVYPGLGFALQTTHPIVAVVSGSMEHDGSFEEWWESAAICEGNTIKCSQSDHYAEYGITQEQFREFKFKNGFNKGDIMILYGKDPGDIIVGDVIVFVGNRPDPIIHRVVDVDEMNYFTKGDHNPTSFNFESNINPDLLIGTAKVRVPFLGYIKIWFVQLVSFIGNIF